MCLKSCLNGTPISANKTNVYDGVANNFRQDLSRSGKNLTNSEAPSGHD